MAKTPKRTSVAKRRATAPVSSRSVGPAPAYDDIAARAYELFMQRGGQHGSDREDWLLAEEELATGMPPARLSTDRADYAG